MNDSSSYRRTAWIMAAFAAVESLWVLVNLWFNGWKFVRYLGFASGRTGEWPGWMMAVIVVALYVGYAQRLPSVRKTMLLLTPLKGLALVLAVSAGILEEVIFRKWIIDAVGARGYGVVWQVLTSGLVFGAAHSIWGIMGQSFRAALGAMVATGVLGVLLAIVYVLSGRSLAPCIAAHFMINALIEPGLMLAATRGEMANLGPVERV